MPTSTTSLRTVAASATLIILAMLALAASPASAARPDPCFSAGFSTYICPMESPLLPYTCSDRLDNDGDGLVDYPADPGCTGPTDNERNPSVACDDGLDNDGEGSYYADYPGDPGCTSPADRSEKGTTACDDGIDNDHDGRIDYGGSGALGLLPEWIDCTSPGDTSE